MIFFDIVDPRFRFWIWTGILRLSTNLREMIFNATIIAFISTCRAFVTMFRIPIQSTKMASCRFFPGSGIHVWVGSSICNVHPLYLMTVESSSDLLAFILSWLRVPISSFVAIVKAFSSSTVSFKSSFWISSLCMFAIKTSLILVSPFSPRSKFLFFKMTIEFFKCFTFWWFLR